jgi:hypothetical protein
MKRLLGLTLALATLLVLVGCGDEEALDIPNVTYTVTDDGATLALDWDEIVDADGYYIYADGAVIDSIDDPAVTTYDATVPAQVYGVSAYNADEESATDDVDCTLEETANITVYGNSDPDPDHPSGIGFTATGTCITLALSETTNWPDIDFYFDDDNFAQLTIVSPGDHVPAYNNEENATAASGTDYDALEIAADIGNYLTQRTMAENAVLSFWIDPDADGWGDANDYFGKMKIVSITGAAAPYTAIINCAYQPIAGLRWVVTQ